MNTCFVIQPFDGGVFDKRYKDVFSPAIKNANLTPYRVDEDPSVSIPIQDIENGIREARICLVDITLDNPNVWYELGYAFSAKKPVVLVCSNERVTKFPFDIQHRSIIRYSSDSPSDFKKLKNAITIKIKAFVKNDAGEEHHQISELVDYSTSRKGHFELAVHLMRKECTKLFVMQRSSTLILGAEDGWGGEEIFLKTLTKSISNGLEFMHIISIDGIINHLNSSKSFFPDLNKSLSNLNVVGQKVAISGPNRNWFLKKIPSESSDPLLKADRQARTLVAKFEDGSYECLLVTDLGGQQGWFSMKGPKVKKFMDACDDFYSSCRFVTESDLEQIKNANNYWKKSKV